MSKSTFPDQKRPRPLIARLNSAALWKSLQVGLRDAIVPVSDVVVVEVLTEVQGTFGLRDAVVPVLKNRI